MMVCDGVVGRCLCVLWLISSGFDRGRKIKISPRMKERVSTEHSGEQEETVKQSRGEFTFISIFAFPC